jgi:hypothetical protein
VAEPYGAEQHFCQKFGISRNHNHNLLTFGNEAQMTFHFLHIPIKEEIHDTGLHKSSSPHNDSQNFSSMLVMS